MIGMILLQATIGAALGKVGAAIGAAAWFGFRKYREKKEEGHLA